jgi:ComF family protein
MSIKTALKRIADTVFPYIPGCVVCGVEQGVDAYLCPGCAADMERNRAKPGCAGAHGAFSAYQYAGPAKALVRRYKYNGDRWLAAFMADTMIGALGPVAFDFVCHVPLHERRRAARGFDQAAELAARIAAQAGKPHVCALRRVRNTRTQTRLSVGERQENMRGAFESVYPVSGRVLLVDDVLTTGATAEAAAAALMSTGAQSVAVLTFARAMLEPIKD